MEILDVDLEWAVRLAMETRRRVKEQQKRIGSAEFRNTHFSYVLGTDGVEQFVSTRNCIVKQHRWRPAGTGTGVDDQPRGMDEHIGLYRIETNEGLALG
jgi:ATP-dependent Lon protease